MSRETSLREAVEHDFLTQLKETFGNNLVSVMLYGSYVSGDFVPGVSDINVLVLLDHPDTEHITSLGKTASRLMRKYNITPLMLTKNEFVNSADVFPMEYADIKERNRVVFGSDETASLVLQRQNLRHQLEEMLRGSVAVLRQTLIASRSRKRVLAAKLKIQYGTLKALCRALLNLKGLKDIPTDWAAVIDTVSDSFAVDASPLKRLLELRRGTKMDVHLLAAQTLSTLEKLIGIVDGMEIGDERDSG
jgi:predicted nucleotidyltransferase